MSVLQEGLKPVNGLKNKLTRTFARDGLSYETGPFVSGYFFVQFKLPPKIFDGSGEKGVYISTRENAENLLNAICTGITLPDVSLEAVNIDGLGGSFQQVPGRLTLGKQITVKFWETENGDIINVFRQWVMAIRDFRSFTSTMRGQNKEYKQSNYKGTVWWFATDPSLSRIIYAAEFMGVWPQSLPINSISNEIATNDKVDFDVNLAIDRFFMYPKTIEFIKAGGYYEARLLMAKTLEQEVGNGGTT